MADMASDESGSGDEDLAQQFRALYEQAPFPYQSLDDEGVILKVNQAWLDELGYEREEVTGKWFGDFLVDGSIQKFHKRFPRFKERGEINDVNFELERKDGTRLTASYGGKVIYDENGNFLRTQCIFKNITESKEREEQLMQYKMAVEGSRDLIAACDENYNYLFANEAYRNLYKVGSEEILNKKVESLVGEQAFREEIKPRVDRCLQGERIEYEMERTHPIKGKRQLRINYYPLKGEEKIHGIVATMRDITARNKAEQELKRSEKRYRTVFENTGTAMMIFGEDTTISLANEEVENLTGYTREEIEGTSWTKIVAREEKLEEMKEYHYRRRENPNSAPNQYEFKLEDKTGNEKDVFVSIDVIPGTDKSVASLIDITDRKKAERGLRKSERKFRSYVENAPLGVSVVNQKGEYVEVNETACAMTGYSREELLKMKALDIHPPEVASEAKEAIERLIDKGELEVELPYFKKDGTKRYMLINAVSISENRYLGFSLDVTERKAAQEKLKQATLGTLQALNRTIEAKDEYTGEHIDRVQKLSVEVGKEVGLSEERLEQLRYASTLHDIGKIGISDTILGKEVQLTEDEWEEMEKHPEIGERIVGQVDQLNRAADIIGQHQEKYDGSGYPKGLKGEEIMLEARIVAVADAWDAMRTDRPYREALPRQEALQELRENAGTQFDPEIVDIMLELIEKGEIKSGEKQ